MWELDHKEGWAPKNWCFELWCWRRLFRVPWTVKKIKPVNPTGNQSWIFTGRTHAETVALILWLAAAKSQLTGKDPYSGKGWGQEKKVVSENEMVGGHHRLSGHEIEQDLGDGEGSLACCSPWDHKESDTTERLKNTMQNWIPQILSKEFLGKPSNIVGDRDIRENLTFWHLTATANSKGTNSWINMKTLH